MLDGYSHETLSDVYILTSKLNEQLRGRFKILHIDKIVIPDDDSEFYKVYLRSETDGHDTCKVLVVNSRVISVDGQILVHNIEYINKAFADIKAMETAS